MDHADVFRPYTAGAFEVYSKTTDLFVQAMKGDLTVREAMAKIEAIANDVLGPDRTP